MLAIEMLPAGHGDALVVEYGTRGATHRVLVDAGTRHSWDEVRARLAAMPDRRYEAFVVTHVDEDHIGGAVKLLADTGLRSRIRDVWFNGYVHSRRGGNVLGPVDGERLTRLIVEGGYRWNHPFPDRVSRGVGGPVVVPSSGPLPRLELPGGATVVLLSPSPPKLKRMANEWEKTVLAAGLVPGQGAGGAGSGGGIYTKKVKALPRKLSDAQLAKLAAPTKRDDKAPNGSSIAFVLEHGGKRALLGADAHPDTLVPALRRYAAEVGEDRVRIDLCKLPHHASDGNVTSEMIEVIDARRYLVSTNGDKFAHPDDAALARIIVSSGRPPAIYCNFATDRTTPWVERGAALGATVVVPKPGRSGLRVSA
jgi:beta-lactamase superfamily II metal-dependent hydrolase